jgi:hypothetical protein
MKGRTLSLRFKHGSFAMGFSLAVLNAFAASTFGYDFGERRRRDRGIVTSARTPESTVGTVERTRGNHLGDAATAARYPSGHAAWPLASPVVLAPHPEGCDQQQHPERHGINPYQPDEG